VKGDELDDISDRNLVLGAQTGDRGAYETLITRYYKRIYSVCLGIVANPHESQDLCQEAMLQGYVKIGRLRDADRFGGWMTEIAKNLCFDWLRKQKKNQKCIAKLADRKKRPQRNHSKDFVTEAVAQLPMELRGPLVMYYFDGRDSHSISRQLGMSHSGVWRRLRQAKEQLYELLSEVTHET
jgi:RNA polymerase sigma-70 factor (ECF subfamily)